MIVVAGSAGTGWRVRASPHGESTRRPGAPASGQPSQASGQNSQGRDERHWSRCISTEPRIADRLLKHSSSPRSDQDERLLPPGPESSQRNPEQLVHGIQSTARPLCVQGQQLLTESQVSRTRSSRERKPLTIHPRRCRSDTIIARILPMSPNRALRQVIHFAGVRRFGEAQPVQRSL